MRHLASIARMRHRLASKCERPFHHSTDIAVTRGHGAAALALMVFVEEEGAVEIRRRLCERLRSLVLHDLRALPELCARARPGLCALARPLVDPC